MQTKTEIQQLLALAGVEPNKRLGQHFLIDLNLMRLLIDSADIQQNDVILEVGCGTGSLTSAIAEKAGHVVVAEYDKILAGIAKEQLGRFENITLINADILDTKNLLNANVIEAVEEALMKYKGRFMLVANLPYNVAGPVMTNSVTGPLIVDAMYVTIQKEVAERMTAKPGGGEYGTLSVFLQVAGSLKLIRILKPTVFWPQPQVESAMVSFVLNRDKYSKITDMSLFCEIVHLFMSHRRKTVHGCSRLSAGRLAQINWNTVFENCCIEPTKRPQQLTPEDYAAITAEALK